MTCPGEAGRERENRGKKCFILTVVFSVAHGCNHLASDPKGSRYEDCGKDGEAEEEGDSGPAWLSSPCQQVEGAGRGVGSGERDRSGEKIWPWAWLLIRSTGVLGYPPQ